MHSSAYASDTTNASLGISQLRPAGPFHTRQKTPVKIYNSNFNKFDYEVNTKQKNTHFSEFTSMITPSNLSAQSLVIHNDMRELLAQAECKDENFITLQEAFLLLKKLRIVSSYGNQHTVFKSLPFQRDVLRIEDFFTFFTAELTFVDFQDLSKEELILKFGVEIFRAVGREDTELKIMDVIKYLKEHKNLGFDLTQIFELFDFYKSEISGSLKNKLSINAFFNKSAPMLHQVFTPEFVQKLRQVNAGIKQDPLRKQQSANPALIKFYDPEKARSARQSITKKLTHDFSVTTKHDMDSPYTASTQNRLLQPDLKDPELEDVFFEVHPKNKGWLMRRSKKHSNKWAMVFCEINEGKFLSAQPTTLKKSIEIKHLEIHKCNFLEIMSRFDFGQSAELKRGHRRTGSQGYRYEKGSSPSPNTEKLRAERMPKLDFCFFILDRKNQKTYLIRSPDNMIIGSIIHFYLHKEKYTTLCTELFSSQFVMEPEFSGVIEIAMCKKKSIGRYHSSLKSYSFKKQFLIMKNGKFNIYEMKVKDNVNLCEFDVKQENSLDILPQTNPYVFTLERLDNQKIREMNMQIFKESLIHEGDENDTQNGYISKAEAGQVLVDKNYAAGYYPDPEYADLVFVEEKKTTKSFIQNFFKTLVSPKKRKTERITLACDTDMKRRQWSLTLNYFIMMYMRMHTRSKVGTTKDSLLYTNEEAGLRSSFQNDFSSAEGNSASSDKRKKKNKPSISFKNTSQDNPDFCDVFDNQAGEGSENQPERRADDKLSSFAASPKIYDSKLVQNTDVPLQSKKPKPINTQSDKTNMPLITEPDANNPLDSEEILFTFTQFNAENLPTFLKNNPQATQQLNMDDPVYLFPQEIKTLNDVELWQKFLIFFLKEAHTCSHFDMQEDINDASQHDNQKTAIDSSRFDCDVIEDEPMVRQVLTGMYNQNNK